MKKKSSSSQSSKSPKKNQSKSPRKSKSSSAKQRSGKSSKHPAYQQMVTEALQSVNDFLLSEQNHPCLLYLAQFSYRFKSSKDSESHQKYLWH